MKRTLSIAMAILMIASCFAFAGCKSKDSTTADAIKIGGTGPLTGGAAIYGNAAKQGAEIAVAEINALGGLQFELKYEDDTNDAEKGVNAYNALKDWGMQIFLGSVTSTPAGATSDLAFEDRYFTLTPSASSTSVVEGNDNVFQMCFTDPNQGLASAEYISGKALASKVAVIWKNDDVYSKGIHDTFLTKAAEVGLDVVSDTTFTSDSANDFSVQLTSAQNAGAELLFLPMYYEPASLILAQASAMGYAPLYFGVDGMDGILTLDNFDTSLAEGVMLLTPFSADATDAKSTAFVTSYQTLYGEVPNQFAADGYDVVWAIYEACKTKQITTDMDHTEICALLIDAFCTMTFDGITGTATWSADGTVSKNPKGMVIQNGVYVGMD